MPQFFDAPWSRRLVALTLALPILIGAALLLSLVMELCKPVWSRPAIGLQVLALGGASALLGARWASSRRFLIYPLVLATTIYLWDATLPPPSLPEGLLRGVVPRLALLALLADGALLLRRHQQRLDDPLLSLRVPVRRGLLPLEGVAQMFRVSPAELRGRLGRAGATPLWRGDEEAIRLADLFLILAQWSSYQPQRGPDDLQPLAAKADLPRRAIGALGVLWFALSTVVALGPGMELRLLADGQAISALAACLLPWSLWLVGAAAGFNLVTLGIAVWVLPRLRQLIGVIVIGGLLSGLGLGLIVGDPCAW